MPQDPDFLRDFRNLNDTLQKREYSIQRDKELKATLSESSTKSISSEIINSSPIIDRYDAGYFTKFKRLPILDPYNPYDGAMEYLFFTKPDLNISGANNPLFTFAKNTYPEILGELESSLSSTACKFRPFIRIN